MLTHQDLRNCLRSLCLHRLRAILSILGIVFGVVAVIVMLSIGEGAKQETLEQIEQLGMNNILIRQQALSDEQRTQALTQRSQGLTWKDASVLSQNIPFLLHYAPLRLVEASLTGTFKQMAPEILATTRAYGEIKNLKLVEGRFLCDLDQSERKLVCVLGYEVAQNLGKEGHSGRPLRLDDRYYEIVGILQPTYWKASHNQAMTARHLDQVVFIPLQADLTQQEGLSEIILQVQDSKQLRRTAQLVRQILSRLHGGYEDYQIVVPQELIQQAQRTHHIFNLILGSLAALSLLVGGIGIMNIMLATVSERTREIGIRRAVGASKQHILMQFLLETFVLSVGGAIGGILLGVMFSMVISTVAGWKTVVTIWSILLALGMALGVGLCAGLYPAFQAATMDPMQALRHD